MEETYLVSDAQIRRLAPTRRGTGGRLWDIVLYSQVVRGDYVVVKVRSVIAPEVATAADKGNVEGFKITPRGHCRHGKREGKSDDEDY